MLENNSGVYIAEQECTTLSGISFGETLSWEEAKSLTCPYIEDLKRYQKL